MSKLKTIRKTFTVDGKKYTISLNMKKVVKALPDDTLNRVIKSGARRVQSDCENAYNRAMDVLSK